METINAKLVEIALSEIDPTQFERFSQSFYSAIFGTTFVPLGGLHDGGADGFIEPELFVTDTQVHFLQASKQSTYRDKINDTIKRLNDYGRSPKSLTYITSKKVRNSDIDEDTLSDKLRCRIRIRDATYIESHINTSPATIAAFKSFLEPSIDHLKFPGLASGIANHVPNTDRTLAVFLRQEVDHRRGKSDLLQSIADSLIIWSLSDTDPDTDKLMTRDEILCRIEGILPSARHFIRGVLDHRLAALRTKTPHNDRQLRYYMNREKYCLPYETRELVKQENVEDLSLRHDVSNVLRRRFHSVCGGGDESMEEKVIDYCHMTFEILFEKQGLELARFLANDEDDDELFTNIHDIVASILDKNELEESGSSLRRVMLRVLRGTFYDSTTEERTYLQKLSKTYALLLMLRNEPRVVDYFRSVSSSFRLYIGTDFIVRSLAEHYLTEDNQTTRNLFRILSDAGAKCILTEKVVEEVSTHLRSQIFEFENFYMHIEGELMLEHVEYIDRILIRAYFYSRLDPFPGTVAPSGWKNFVEQFGPYDDIRKSGASESIARYLVEKFSFEYESASEMLEGLDESDVESLAEKIFSEKRRVRGEQGGQKVLAYNDALHACLVYHRRREGGEHSPANPFGFRTWWLTQDSGVRRAAADLTMRNGNQRFMMRPEFLLNFIAMNPNKADVEKSYRSIFPCALGVQLANRMSARRFKDIIKEANKMWSVDPARASVIVSESLNSLKGDQVKVYEHRW